ncbi:MAG: hypothetical protein HYZ83_01700 [Candidatus Omnitrophica bacterium]|nr:hypothetical protein [Candidatus Omnitrophota bacterium]
MKKTLINRTKSIFTPQPGDFFFLLLFIFVAVRGQTLLMDGDTSLHIRAGQVILSTHGFPKENIFSFVPNLKWGPYEWLSQTLTALIYGWSGFAGVIIFFSFLIAWVHSLVFEDLRKRTYPLAAILLMGLMLFNSRLHWLARPHIFSLLFYWVFYRVLEKYQNENTNKLYFLPLLMILWVNVHAGFVLGTAFIAIYITGNLWRALQNQSERNRHLEKAKVFALTFFACAVAASINPDGFYMLVFPFELLSKIFNNIRELVSPDFHAFPAFGVYLILMTITFAFSSASMNIFQLLFLILALHISLSSIRHIPTAVLITVPIWAEQTKSLIDTQLPALRPFFQKQPAKTSKKSELTSWIWKAVGRKWFY